MRGKEVLSVEDIPGWLMEQVINGKMDPRHDHLDNVRAPVEEPTGALE